MTQARIVSMERLADLVRSKSHGELTVHGTEKIMLIRAQQLKWINCVEDKKYRRLSRGGHGLNLLPSLVDFVANVMADCY